MELLYTSPLFEEALGRLELSAEQAEAIRQQVAETGSCQEIEELPPHIRDTFVVSGDITADEHVRMQGGDPGLCRQQHQQDMQLPLKAQPKRMWRRPICRRGSWVAKDSRSMSPAAVRKWCWRRKRSKTGRTSRLNICMAQRRSNGAQPYAGETGPEGEYPEVFTKRPRPYLLQGNSYRKETPLGTAYVTINSDENHEPFEVFLNIGKAGSDVTAVSESIGRLISLVLRMPSVLPPSERLRWVIDEMAGIGGGRPLGFGVGRVRSLPDGVAQVLTDHLSELPENREAVAGEQLALPIGDLCPDCGEAAFLNVEGCRKCHVCGYSEC